jgi:hypothetical protein
MRQAGGVALLALSLLGMAAQGPAVPIETHAAYRLVPVGRTQSDTTRWRLERRVMHGARGAWGLQVMIATRGGRTTWDSVGFDPVTLALVWERSNGPSPEAIRVSGSRLLGVQGSGDARRAFAAQAPGPVYSSTMDDFVIQRWALAAPSPRVLDFWDGDHLERDTVRVRENGAQDLVVEFAEPYAVETLWIDRESFKIIRHRYQWRHDGTQSETVMD